MLTKSKALRFVLFLGFVSLFADMTYEGARSITGPYLALLGANAAIVGFVAGFGEFIGYALRLFSGYLADKTGRYWTITIIGYAINLLAVPLLALTNHWWTAAILIISERAGRALRIPARDAMLSHAGPKIGMGWVFGLHEAIDQIGAMLGPLIIALILYYQGSYQQGFAILLIPALIALTLLTRARWLYPHPHELEAHQDNLDPQGMKNAFWLYLLGASLIAAGYADFPLIAYHFQKTGLLSPVWIPISYAIAVGLNSLTAPLFGHLYDRKGFIVLIIVSLLSTFFAPLVFLGNFHQALLGIILWSTGVGAHESLMRAIVANMTPKEKRGSAYGIFNTGFGIFWFLGSFAMGLLYDKSIPLLVGFSIAIQLLALPLLWLVKKKL
ncbi:Major Facilitator Superfamily protein [Legionella massiliensis]|uniref:Major Facilitator Superfamily protein n=1 Tax=Legionella massiliensis TaxID=1034943 RepID=A0A078KVI9_9GAMM|nr:MFS transporter [Legionella massiliensis]CDZ77017.1 Major Facilitator Superfamily protein [Legionella massiliensis]CEE12755.1 Major Facilitator Superfamily protein [Legionella massiliensis]